MRYAIILAALLLAGCGGKSLPGSGGWAGGGPATVSMNPTAWACRYASPCQITAAGTGFTLMFPAEIDYLTTNVSIAAKDRVIVKVQVEAVSGAPTFSATDGCAPATFGIMLEVRNDDMRSEDGRWWSRLGRPALTATMQYVLDIETTDLSQWSNVQGHIATDRPAQFNAAIANLGAVGLTFGACAFGHGVSVNGGSAKMTVTEFTVQ
jgi:hypothetical protein